MDTFIGWAGLAISAVGLAVTFYTLTRVKKVQDAQNEARRFTEDLLNIDQLEVDLVRVMDKLRTIQDADSPALVGELGVKLGTIRGVRRALAGGDAGKSGLMPTVSIGTGFFGDKFLGEMIEGSKERIDIITGRTKLVAGYFVVDRLREACQRGVKVRLIGLSDEAPDEILEDSLKTVSNPAPKSAADYRRQIKENAAEILSSLEAWPSEAQHNFEYRLSTSVPRVSLLRCDSTVNFGFLQFYRDAQPQDLKEREYFRIPIATMVGKTALRHFDLVWEESKNSRVWPGPTVDPLEAAAPLHSIQSGEPSSAVQ